MSAFKARYEGRCRANCGAPIAVGDRVVYVDDELVHEGCEGVARTVAARDERPVCTSCFLMKPCPCDDGQGPNR